MAVMPFTSPANTVANPVIREDILAVIARLSRTLAPLEGTSLLVTGGSGFLCSYFLETVACLNDEVFRAPCRVISVDNLRTGSTDRVAHLAGRPDFIFLQHDVSTPLALPEPVDRIIHGAGIASPTFYRRHPLETIDVNVSGTRQMLELARSSSRVRSILYFSTSEIYGDPDPQFIPTPEDYRGFVSCTGPRACYDESKRLAETLCAIYQSCYSTPVKIVRPFNVYGPGQRLDDRRVIPDMISAALRRDPLVLLSDGRATRAFCYISDAITAMWHVLMSGFDGEAFNVGNDEREITMHELAEEMRQAAGPPWLDIRMRASDDPHYLTDNPQRRCPDLTKLRSRFDWTPQVSLAEGLRRTLLSYNVPGGPVE
jgi:UDP-glucuronate decarboxylase